MKQYIAASPLTEQEKAQVFSQFTAGTTQEAMLRSYIDFFVAKNKLKNYEMKGKTRVKLIVSICLAVVAALEIYFIMLYHYNGLYVLVFGKLAVFLIIALKSSIAGDLYREVVKRPDDNIDNILVSQVSGARNRWFGVLKAFIPFLAVLLGTIIIFWKPHMIFEKNDGKNTVSSNSGIVTILPSTDGQETYSLRYYTYSLHPEKRVVIPETYKGLPVVEVRGEVFKNMSSLYSVKLPSGITEIRGSTFEECSNLREIEIPKGVTRIGGHAFYGCSNLSYVLVPSTVTEIGSSAFRRCSSLKTIKIPEGASVNDKAFKESPTEVIRY